MPAATDVEPFSNTRYASAYALFRQYAYGAEAVSTIPEHDAARIISQFLAAAADPGLTSSQRSQAARFLREMAAIDLHLWVVLLPSLEALAQGPGLDTAAVEGAVIALLAEHPRNGRVFRSARTAAANLRYLLEAPGMNSLERRRVAVAALCAPTMDDGWGAELVKLVETAASLTQEERVDVLWRPLRRGLAFEGLADWRLDLRAEEGAQGVRDAVARLGPWTQFYRPFAFSGSVRRHAVPALYRLGEPIGDLLAAATSPRPRDIAGWLGALDLIESYHQMVPRPVLDQYLDRGLELGQAAVRKRALQVGAVLRGADTWKRAQSDRNKSLRRLARTSLGLES